MLRYYARRDWVTSVGQTFAQRFRERRRYKSGAKSQQHIALTMVVVYGHISWHQTTVAKVESGEREVKLTEAVALAEIIGVPLSELIGEPGASRNGGEGDGKHPEED